MNRRLYRCRHDRRIAGVASGLAEFFDLDPTLVRILWFVSIFFGGVSILVYVGLAVIIPSEPLTEAEAAGVAADAAAAATPAWAMPAGHRHQRRTGGGRWTTFLGWALILFGALAFYDVAFPGATSWRYLWPIFALGLGAYLVWSGVRREPEATVAGPGAPIAPAAPIVPAAAPAAAEPVVPEPERGGVDVRADDRERPST